MFYPLSHVRIFAGAFVCCLLVMSLGGLGLPEACGQQGAPSAPAQGQPQDEWEPYRKTGVFPGDSKKWVAPDMTRESVEDFTRRILDGARNGEPKSMASLGRFFYVRGDGARALEWLRKAAEAGHTGAQFDLGSLQAKGTGLELAEAYQWLWLATWAKEPGADAVLEQLSARIEAWQMLLGVRKAAEFQERAAKQGK